MTKTNRPTQVITIGASAGGLEPLQLVLSNLPDKLMRTSVIIAQHTSPDYKSMLVSILEKHSKIKIYEAENGLSLEQNAIYTVPPDTDAEVVKNKFVFKRPSKLGPKPSVDKLFTSLASEFKEKCIGVILSGTGHDGSKGILDIKNEHGFIMVQEPETSKYAGMPVSAIKTGAANLILSPEQIGEELPKLFDKDYRASIVAESNKIVIDNTSVGAINKVLNLLQERKRTDFGGYKTSTIYRRLDKRISDKDFADIKSYAAYLEDNKDEIDNLFEYLLIGVTNFFRNPHSFEMLRQYIKVQLANKTSDETYRVWIPGCATGEEAYTLAMIIYDLLSETSYPASQVQIFATDIDQKPLKTARIGVYDEESIESVPSYYRKKYFIKDGKGYQIKSLVKKLILFSKHDLTNNPPFLRLDLISCRNLMIYFKTELQNQILPLFHYSLNPDGLLFLGKSENIGQFKNLFSTESGVDKIFKSKTSEYKIAHIPLLKPLARRKKSATEKVGKEEKKTLLERIRDTLYNGFDDAYVVVDDSFNIIEIKNDISPYLKLKQGVANLNIVKLAIPAIQMELRSVISKAISSHQAASSNIKKLSISNKIQFLKLIAQPLLYSEPNQSYFLIIFHKIDVEEQFIAPGDKAAANFHNSVIPELEHELATTKEHMNTLIEELETSNEELQSLNEELQSSNEELQASNEELETSNEELQATNEELNVAYSELRSATNEVELKSVALEKSQDNLQSLLNNTQQAFILIDRDYKVIIFNRTAHVICKDIFGVAIRTGTLFIDLIPSAYLSEFHNRIKQAFQGKQLKFVEKVKDLNDSDRYLSFNYTPVDKDYSREHLTQVSISFIDITVSKKTEIELLKAQRETENQRKLWQNLFLDAPQLIAILAGDEYEYQFVNKSYQQVFPDKEFIGKKMVDVLPIMEKDGFVDTLDKVRKTNTPYATNETKITVYDKSKDNSKDRYFDFTYYPVIYENTVKPDIIVYATDVTSQVEARKTIEDSNLFMALVADGLPNHVWVLNADGSPSFVNQQSMDYLGFDYSKTGLAKWINSIHSHEKEETEKRLNEALSTGESFQMEHRIKDIKGNYQWFLSQSSPLRDKLGYISKWIGSSTHIHEQKMLNNRKDEFIGIASHELKTPLTSVKAYTELLEDHLQNSEDEEALLYLDKANKNISKLEGFISDLLDVSRVQAGKLKLHIEEFNFDALVKETVESMNHTSMDHHITMIGKTKIKINADRGRIEQVIVNFINNAIKYSPQDFRIEVTVKKVKEYIKLSVIDNGIGIPSDRVDKIFDRFFRIEEHSNHISGLGIGLNICRDIVKMHRGDIGVNSIEGKGSTFYFKLPIHNSKNA